MLAPYVTIDYLAEARSRVTSSFEDKVIFDKFLQLLMYAQIDIQQALKDLMQLRSIDTATGAQLDNIGEIVGQDRVLLNADFYNFFGFQDALKAGTFGDVTNTALGSVFLNYGSPLGGNIILDDATYRLFIKAKIFKNTTASTPEEFLEAINLIFGTTTTQLTEEGNADVTVMFSRSLSDFERAVLTYISTDSGYPSRLIPKTVGVGIRYGEYDGDSFFGFDGVAGALGFGDLSTAVTGYGNGYGFGYGAAGTTLVGGTFATLY